MKHFLQSIFAVVAILMVSGCGDPKLDPIKSALEDPSGNLHLIVSNQSFAISRVDIRVSIDGTPVVQKYFDVGDQHNFQEFVFKLATGQHKIVVTSLKGKATLERTFEAEDKDKLGAVLMYWYYPKDQGDTPRSFTFEVNKGKVGFM
jgi:hypothetical protein